MQLYVVDNYQQMSEKAAGVVANQVASKNDSVLGLATGSTPEGMYQELINLHRQGTVDFSRVTTFNLDEYIGLSPDHPQSYNHYMHSKLFNHININPEHINIPSGVADDIEAACNEYEQKISAVGGIDLQLLGIGVNGHIGFNEPAESLPTFTHRVNLSAATIEANSRFFDSQAEVPRQAITMGLGSIMHARRILLLASGRNKAEAIRNTINGKIATQVPASLLQLHRELILIVDQEAAALI